MGPFVNEQGLPILIGRELAAGGEGKVFDVPATPSLVAKVYHTPPSQEKAAKLAAMVRIAGEELSKFAAWPKSLFYEPKSRALAGLLMPRIDGARQIHELDTPAHRKSMFPTADWRFLARVARNCAASVTTVHHYGIVIGDINHGGFLVTPHGTVKLIDCDSFQFSSGNHKFLCDVAVPEFLPPELFGQKLDAVERTANHDNFGLAILIFRLLMMGRHPFAGYRGKGTRSIPEAIKEYRFAFGPNAWAFEMVPPLHSPLLKDLGPTLSSLFIRAFAPSSHRPDGRPTALQWVEALEGFESSLVRCSVDATHFHHKEAADCCWCRIEAANGPYYFISVAINSQSDIPSFDMERLWQEILAIENPSTYFTPLQNIPAAPCTPQPLPAKLHKSRELVVLLIVLSAVASLLCFLALITPTFLYICLPIAIILWIGAIVVHYLSPAKRVRRERQKALNVAIASLGVCDDKIAKMDAKLQKKFAKCFASLSAARTTLTDSGRQEAAELQQLQAKARERQLEDHLDKHFIRDAQIEDFEAGRITFLEAYGIETASDVNDSALEALPGFGRKYAQRLTAWKKEIAAKFRFNPSQGLPPTDLAKIRSKYSQLRANSYKALQNGKTELQQIVSTAKLEAEKFCDWRSQCLQDVAQATEDLTVC